MCAAAAAADVAAADLSQIDSAALPRRGGVSFTKLLLLHPHRWKPALCAHTHVRLPKKTPTTARPLLLLSDVSFACRVGVASGQYLFAAPLQQYWEQQAAQGCQAEMRPLQDMPLADNDLSAPPAADRPDS